MRTDACAVGRYARTQLDALSAGIDGVRAADPDAVHDTRVAARRLRSTVRSFPIEDGDQLAGALQWFGRVLGELRDTQVMAERLDRALAVEPRELVVGPVAARIRSVMAARIAAAHKRVLAALAEPAYGDLLDRADTAVAGGLGRARAPAEVRRVTARALRRAERRLRRADRSPVDSAGLHAARRAYKRARYAAEIMRPDAGRLVRRIGELQDALGAYQDSVVTRGLLRELGMRAYLDGENTFTYGLLYARQDEAGRGALAQIPRLMRRHRYRRW
jgi:CHAD domain-containing protein